MKAEDLMIGDWAYIKDYPIIARAMQVKKEHFVRSLVEFEPIPLTTEILDKNGFGFVDTSNEYYSSVWTGWWILEGLELGCCDNSKFPVFFNIADTNVKVNYVHELQHALKICGIKKEIVL